MKRLNDRRIAYFCRQQIVVVALVLLLCLGMVLRARAQNDVIYRFEKYQEDDGRIAIETQSGQIDTTVFPWLSLKGQISNDAVSGATPPAIPSAPSTCPPIPRPPRRTIPPTASPK